MAKSDFCFTYYDGDAARDMSHMNRLERGAYTDVVISQRKFGRLTIEQIQKILGRDFTECWGAIELILKQAEGKFFIEWLEVSEIKAKKQSKKQSENVRNRYQPDTNPIPKEPLVTPLGDGDGDGIEEKLKGALDEMYLDQERIKWPHLDFDYELLTFCNKVRGSPGEYNHRNRDKLRLAFQYQLRKGTSKTKQNGTNKNISHVASLADDFAKRHGAKAD